MNPTVRIDIYPTPGLAKELEEYANGKHLRPTILELLKIGLTIMKNKQNFQDPQFIQSIIENVTSDRIDNFFDNLEPQTLEAMYVYSKSEMEKRYGKSRLDKFV